MPGQSARCLTFRVGWFCYHTLLNALPWQAYETFFVFVCLFFVNNEREREAVVPQVALSTGVVWKQLGNGFNCVYSRRVQLSYRDDDLR